MPLNTNRFDVLLIRSYQDDASLVASLLLSVGVIWPYCFELEHPVELETSFSSETKEVYDHPGEKWLGNATIVLQTQK